MDEKHRYYVKEKLISEGKMEELMIRRRWKTDKMISAKATNHFMHPEGTPNNRTPLRWFDKAGIILGVQITNDF